MGLYQNRQGDFYDLWEQFSEERRQEIIRSRLNDIVNHAVTNTPYYRKIGERYQVDIKKEHPLSGIPILTSSHLKELLPPLGSDLLSRDDKAYTIFQSGGTTGLPKTSLFTDEELEGLNLPNARGFFAVGLNENDRVANLFAVGGLYMTFIHINRMLQQFGCTNLPFSNQTPAEFVGRVCEHFNVNCFTGITSSVLSCLRHLHENQCRLNIDKLFYGGEHIYEADRLEMKEKFGIETILAPGYGTVDTWYIGYQCLYSAPGVFHAHDDQCFIEIVDEDHPEKKNCGAKEVGMIYATPFERRLTPIVRYRVGDRAYWMEGMCRCGRTTPRFQLLGRGDDVLRIGYDSIDYAMMQKLVTKIPGLTGTMQIEKQRVEGRDLLIIRVETPRPTKDHNHLRKHFREALLQEKPSLQEFVKKGLVIEPQIEFYPLTTIPLNSRTGKLVRVIDCL